MSFHFLAPAALGDRSVYRPARSKKRSTMSWKGAEGEAPERFGNSKKKSAVSPYKNRQNADDVEVVRGGFEPPTHGFSVHTQIIVSQGNLEILDGRAANMQQNKK